MRIALGSDHAGFLYKERAAQYLRSLGHDVVDFGTSSTEPVDYPDMVVPAARAVASGACDRGLVFGGSGNGEAMAANRVRGVRCALVWSPETARLARAHNDANVLAIGARMISEAQMIAFIDIWLTTPFDGGRHRARIEKLDRV